MGYKSGIMSKVSSRDHNTLFPVFLKLESLDTLVVGGGNVALEKLKAIFENSPDARVKLVASAIIPEVMDFILGKGIPFEERPFLLKDLDGPSLVIVAINDRTSSKVIHEACVKRKILANVADTPEYCDFYLGSIVRKGNLKIAISTNGKSPTVAKRVKEVLNESFPSEIDEVLNNMEKIRGDLKGNLPDKVKALNEITTILVSKLPSKAPEHK
jgi:siroheme synthase-like protein